MGLLQQTTREGQTAQQQQAAAAHFSYRTSTLLYLANGAAATRISEILEILSYIYGFFESSSQSGGRAVFGQGRLTLIFSEGTFFLQYLFRHTKLCGHIIMSYICK
jgi:hypothetical protein